ELPDQRQIGLALAGVGGRRQAAEKLLRSAVRNRPQVLDELIVSQADAVVADDEQLGLFVGFERDLEGRAVAVDFFGELNVPELIERVGGVRDQLAERDLAVLVQRVRQDVQQLLDLGLKREFLLFGHDKWLLARIQFGKLRSFVRRIEWP